jgi:hypothetical protein
MTLAQLDMDDGRWPEAAARLRQASEEFAAAEENTGEADADAMLALCSQRIGDTASRDQAAKRARTLRQSITSRQEVYVVDIALALLAGRSGTDKSAVQNLMVLSADAGRRHWLAWSLEAKLAAWELLNSRGAAAAAALRTDIDDAARAHGFGRVRKLLRRPAAV